MFQVSALSFGTWTTVGLTVEEDNSYEIMTTALKHGVNFFDNAETYGDGKSEISMGKILQRWFSENLCRRSDLVISTKLFWSGAHGGMHVYLK